MRKTWCSVCRVYGGCLEKLRVFKSPLKAWNELFGAKRVRSGMPLLLGDLDIPRFSYITGILVANRAPSFSHGLRGRNN